MSVSPGNYKLNHILIIGIESLLGTYFAARWLHTAKGLVFYFPGAVKTFSAEEILDRISQVFLQLDIHSPDASMRRSIEERLHRVMGDATQPIGAEIDEVWYFADPTTSPSPEEVCGSLTSACPTTPKRINYVEPGTAGREFGPDGHYQKLTQCLKIKSAEHRIFRTSLIAGTGFPESAQGSGAFLRFLTLLHSFKTEIEERLSQYFDFQALRCFAPPDAAVNVITAEAASELLIRIARQERPTNGSFPIISPQHIPFADLCERIGIGYGISILGVKDFGAFNAIDRSFHERLGDLPTDLKNETPVSSNIDVYQVVGLAPESAILDEDAQIELFESIRQSQDKAWGARKRRIADLMNTLRPKTVARGGLKLNYYTAGLVGTPIVILNALGQGLEYWYRLIDRLQENYRVIIWEPRGTVSPPPPFGLRDQVDDVDAILQQEDIQACHLIGWCTGPKVAIEFYLRHPSIVSSMAFLNTTFKCDGSPGELNSPYEQNLDSLCHMVIQRPATAASVMKTLKGRVEESAVDILEETDAEQRSIMVLQRMNENLQAHVLMPFQTEQTTFNYAHQMADFWAHDVRAKASDVRIPVLLIGTEYDQVATPEASAAAARLFPDARHVHIRGATHYCLYDRPEFVSELLQTFFVSPAAVQSTPYSSETAASYGQDAANQPNQLTTSNL